MLAFKINDAYRHFGYNAPKSITVNASGQVTEEDTIFIDSVKGKTDFPLDSDVEDMTFGTTVLVQGFFYPDEEDDPAINAMAAGTSNQFEGALPAVPHFASNFVSQENRVRLTVMRQVIDTYPCSATRGSFTGPAHFIMLDEELATKLGPKHYSKIDISII